MLQLYTGVALGVVSLWYLNHARADPSWFPNRLGFFPYSLTIAHKGALLFYIARYYGLSHETLRLTEREYEVGIPSLASILKKRVKLSNWVSFTHSSKSTLGSLFLKLHEIFIPWTFMRIHTIHRNPLPFPRVESSRAWHFFNHRYMGSRDHLGFNVFTICTKMVYAHVRFPVWM